MKMGGNTLDKLREAAEGRVNVHFASRPHLHEAEYAFKSMEAARVVNGGTSDYLAAEARLVGITMQELAEQIFAKQHVLAERALMRRRAILDIRKAQSHNQLNAILKRHDIEQMR